LTSDFTSCAYMAWLSLAQMRSMMMAMP
jgi:hypothetical protein